MDPAAVPFIKVFHGHLSPHTAVVYAQVAGIPGGKPWSLTGHIRGPQCRHARTLPTTHTFTDLGPGEHLLAEATIPDPCFWSPDLPALYRWAVELRHEDTVVLSIEQEFGLHFLGTRGNSFFLEGKRWVLRGIHQEAVWETPLEQWREVGAAMVVDQLRDELFCETSREGVMVVARVGGTRGSRVFLETEANDPRQVTPELSRLSQWGSVGFLIAADQNETATALKPFFPNTIVVETDAVVSGGTPAQFSPVAILDVTTVGLEKVGQMAARVPVIALRRLKEPGLISLDEARAACDTLQSDLAPYGDCAGYVV